MSEILKEEIERFFKEKSICILKEENKRLQAENEELGKIIQCKTGTIYVLKSENERLKDDKNRYELYIKEERDNNYKYKRGLEEIREYAKPVDELCKNCEHDRFLCDNECECNAYRLKKIEDKLSEVLG